MLINKTIGQLHYKGWIWRNTLSITPAFVNLSLAWYILSVEALLTCLIRRKLLLLDADFFFHATRFKDVRLACLFDLSFMSACNSRLEFLFYWAQDCFAECGTITYSTHDFFRPICNTWIINTGGGKHTQTFLLLSLLVHILPKLSNQERESKTQATFCSLSLQTSLHSGWKT